MALQGPAIGFIELESLARGPVVADAILKRAHVELVRAEAVSPGKFLILFQGGVGEVQESFAAGLETVGPRLIDKLFLPQPHRRLLDALSGKLAEPLAGASLGIVETQSVAAGLLAADAALKRADVALAQLALARGIGGKATFVVTGEQHQVEAGLEGATGAVAPELLGSAELIARPEQGLWASLAR